MTKNMTYIVRRLANGDRPKEVAYDLGITLSAANERVRGARHRAKATTNEHLLAMAIRNGWVD